jgi:hypothetical protein
MHLTRIRIAELSGLEVNDEHATQPSVEEHEINAEPKYRPSLRYFAENGLFLWFFAGGNVVN